MSRNGYIDWQNAPQGGNDEGVFPSGLVSAPVVIDSHGTEYNTKFYGGLVGVTLAESKTVQAESGW